ncbi:OmpA family protein [Thalassobius sp. Cn5-15]|uniref:OmpA family protein n=1 Tax=Thalassobius sp. Cn5-15 TaxID=2917763 RepID=UPI001EF19775|nr:OmpA family protein [Thalassobius sp. Cn5-15]MCG7492777.1 OmpA family protein [Thalassobius sp. Cn5-15]
MAKKPIPLPVLPVEEPKQEEPPKCPPVGAPAWMATFADIAILLMAFFVLILSFAEFNQPKFKMIAGSLRESFGVQRDIPVVEQPRGTTVLELKFSPSSEPSITKELTQDTTTTEQPKIRSDVDDQQSRSDHDSKQAGEEGKSDEEKRDEMRQELAQLLKQALEQGELTAKVEDDQVVLDYQPASGGEGSLDQTASGEGGTDQSISENRFLAEERALQQQQAQQAANNSATDQQDGLPQTDPLTGLPRSDADSGLPQTADATTAQQSEEALMAELIDRLNDVARDAMQATEDGDQGGTAGDGGREQAGIAAERLAASLHRELGEGLVEVEQRDGKVFVTVGAGGAFPSGTADLTQGAREIMDRIAFAAMNDASSITVTGHTDDVPVSAGSQFRDNWGLAAARSASVVRELAGSGLIDPAQLTATSMGESQPVADNATAAGREENRRIEIEISY